MIISTILRLFFLSNLTLGFPQTTQIGENERPFIHISKQVYDAGSRNIESGIFDLVKKTHVPDNYGQFGIRLPNKAQIPTDDGYTFYLVLSEEKIDHAGELWEKVSLDKLGVDTSDPEHPVTFFRGGEGGKLTFLKIKIPVEMDETTGQLSAALKPEDYNQAEFQVIRTQTEQ